MADLFTLWGKIAIDATVANETINGTMEKVTTLTGTLQIVGNQAEKSVGSKSKLGSASVWLGNTFTKLTDGAVNLAKKLGGIGFGYNAGVETATTHISTLLKGDTEAAENLVAQIEKLATLTPLGTSGLTSNAKELLGYGIALEDILPTLEMLGNYAMGDQTKLDGIVRAYGQIYSQGKLMAQDANQLINNDVPIFQLLSGHAGGKYEGLTKADMIGDKDNPLLWDDFYAAMVAGVSEGGSFHNAMFATLDDYNGMVDRLSEEGEQTLGKLLEPFFEFAKSDVLPKMMESLSGFGTWVSENQEVLGKMADAVGGFVSGGFDAMISAFTWLAENGEAVKIGLGGIAAGLIAGAIAAHPYAAAITAIASALMWMTSELNNADSAANKAAQSVGTSVMDATGSDFLSNFAAMITKNSTVNPDAPWLPNIGVMLEPSEESAAEMQTAIEGYALEGEASINASPDSQALIQAALDSMNLEAGVTLKPKSFFGGIFSSLFNGSHASGLDRVPFDGYRAILHKDEAVLTATEAAVYRGEKKNQTGKRNGYEANSGQIVNVTQNIQAVPMTPSELAAQTKYALGMLRFSV